MLEMRCLGSFKRLNDILGEDYVSLSSSEEKEIQEDSSLVTELLFSNERTQNTTCMDKAYQKLELPAPSAGTSSP